MRRGFGADHPCGPEEEHSAPAATAPVDNPGQCTQRTHHSTQNISRSSAFERCFNVYVVDRCRATENRNRFQFFWVKMEKIRKTSSENSPRNLFEASINAYAKEVLNGYCLDWYLNQVTKVGGSQMQLGGTSIRKNSYFWGL